MLPSPPATIADIMGGPIGIYRVPELSKLHFLRLSTPSQLYRPLKSAKENQPLDDVSWLTEK